MTTRKTLGAMLGLIAVVAVAHGAALRNGFLYDDYHLIVENPAVLSHAWAAVWTSTNAASRDAQGRGFRPATLSTFVIDHLLGDGRPAVYHATQLALHATAAWLVYRVATALGLAAVWAGAAALLVAVHPAQTEAVQYLSARSSVLSTVALLGSFLAYLRWRRGLKVGALGYAVSATLFALAVLSKEAAVVGVVWFAAYERLAGGTAWAEIGRRVALYVAVAAATVAVSAALLADLGSGATVSTDVAVATGLVAVGRHLATWFVPVSIAPVSPQPWIGWSDPAVWGAVGLLAIVSAAAAIFRGRRPVVTWGIVCGGSSLVPVMALPFVTNVALFQPHRGYQAAVGLAIGTAAVAAELAQRALAATRSDWGRRTIRIAGSVAGAAVAVTMVVGDARAGRAWRDEVGFWAEAVAQYPNEASYHHSLGAARLRAGDPSGAVEALTAAARLDPVLPRVDFNLGLAYTKLGQYQEAIAAYERAVALDPADVKSLANAGWLYERGGETGRAARFYRAALAVDPGLGAVRERLARLDGRPEGGARSRAGR